MEENGKLLLVLDIDETLVYATKHNDVSTFDFEVFNYKVVKRPHLDTFLSTLKEHFQIGVWSSASDEYVKEIVTRIFPEGYPLKFVWGRTMCTRRVNYQQLEETGIFDYDNHLAFVKKVERIARRLNTPIEKILVVDDTPSKAALNYGNVIYPTEFKGNADDNELIHLAKYLITLKDVENVRQIEKRYWRKLVSE